ncbi:MAG: ABC transporter transmembrane domain-containing protein, partial [Candidatus Eisenbacteria bacterium]
MRPAGSPTGARGPGGRERVPTIRDLTARLLPYLARYRRGLTWGLACVLLANWISLAQPQVLRRAVDDLYRGVTAAKLGRYAVLYFAIALAGALFRFLMRRHVIGISRSIEYDLRNDLFGHLQTLPAQYYQTHRTGEIMSRATNDLSAVRMMLGPGVLYLFNTVAVAVASIAFMLAISPRLTLYTLIPLPLVSFSVWYFGERIHRRFEAIQAHFATIAARVQENLSGVRLVRAFAIEDREQDDFRALNQEYRQRNLELISTSGLFHPGLGFLSGLAALLALILGGREVISGHISLGQFVAFTAY